MIFLLIIGIIFVVTAVYFAAKELKFRSDLNSGKIQSIKAICTDYAEEYEKSENGNYVVHYPVYEYNTDGMIKKYQSSVNGHRHKIGDDVTLYQNIKTGEIKESNTVINLYITIGCGIMGLAFLAVLFIRFYCLA